jgi:hypothetical protein
MIESDDIQSMVESQLRGSGRWFHRDDHTPVEGLCRAARDAGELAPVFARAIVNLLQDSDALVRAGAILSIESVAEHVSADGLLSILEARPQLFRGVKRPTGYPGLGEDLEEELIAAIELTLTSADKRAIRFLQDRVVAGAPFGVNALASAIPEWVVANAKAVVQRDAIVGVLRSLPEAGQRRAVVIALSPWGKEEGRALVESPFWRLPLNMGEIDKEELAELTALVLDRSE